MDNAPAHPKNQRITANAPAGGGLMSHLHPPGGGVASASLTPSLTHPAPYRAG
jgi:hypothetical protein